MQYTLTEDVHSDGHAGAAGCVGCYAGVLSSVTALGRRLQDETALCGEDHAPTGPCDEGEGLPHGRAGECVRGALSDGDDGREGNDGWRDWREERKWS